MKENQCIKYHKWDKITMKNYFKSIKDVLNIKSSQFYIPFYSLYFYVHNTPLSHKIMDLDRKYYLIHIQKIIKEKYYKYF